ncbi:MAG: DUF2336 domain-containing protein [Sphingomicrobium sp.]
MPIDRGAPARRAGRGRLATVRRDFFLDGSERLTEQERALMTAMLHALAGDVADELRAALPVGWAGANDGDNHRLIERLTQSGLLDDEALFALLLRSAEAERIAIAAQSRANRRESRILQTLVSHENGPAAAAAMALVLARGRRRDRLGQCLLTIDDIPLETAERLARRIAAALRPDFIAAHGPAAIDDALARATATLAERHDSEKSLEALTRELVALLDSAGQLDDGLLLSAAAEGEIAFLAHALARRAGVGAVEAAEELISEDPARAMALLRMGGASREFAAGLLAGSGDLLALDADGRSIEAFDCMTAADVDSARAWLLAHEEYREALDRLEGRRG